MKMELGGYWEAVNHKNISLNRENVKVRFMPPTRSHLLKLLHGHANARDAVFLQTFFKTGPGQYGEGDIFIGVRIPAIRKLLPLGDALPLPELEKMLHSRIHEERLFSLMVLVRQFKRGDEAKRGSIVDLYLKNTRWVNNWDLVDQSAYHILGTWLVDKPRALLTRLAKSRLLWDRRIAIVCTYTLIRRGEFQDTLDLSKFLINDPEDLMHKACGWMLREVGKRDEKMLRCFLDENAGLMPRTMLRYAIEKFPEKQRKRYLKIRECYPHL